MILFEVSSQVLRSKNGLSSFEFQRSSFGRPSHTAAVLKVCVSEARTEIFVEGVKISILVS